MERLFELDITDFAEQMSKISDEAWEAFDVYLFRDRIPDDRELCDQFLKVVFALESLCLDNCYGKIHN